MMNAFIRLFEQRVRGVRLIELVGISLALIMIFWVCLSKAREGEDIKRMNDLDGQISDQQQQVTDLKVKVAELERPARLEQLAQTYLNMKPVAPTHETKLDDLAEISHSTSRPVVVPAVAAVPAPPAAPIAAHDDLISTVDAKVPPPPPPPPASLLKPAQKAAGAL